MKNKLMHSFFLHRLDQSEKHQSGINMVDLMMWLVIAALLLASAIQGIGFYQYRAYIEQMSTDAASAGQIAVARVSMADGVVTQEAIREAIEETNPTGDVELISRSLGNGHYAVEATHPEVDGHKVIYSFAPRDKYEAGVNLVKAAPVNVSGFSSLADTCADGSWHVQYYNKTILNTDTPNIDPTHQGCEPLGNKFSKLYGEGTPYPGEIPVDYFAVHFTQNLNVTEAKEYTFKIRSDNASWVYVDGKEIIDSSVWHGRMTERNAVIRLTPGKHNVTIKYNEHGGSALLHFEYLENS